MCPGATGRCFSGARSVGRTRASSGAIRRLAPPRNAAAAGGDHSCLACCNDWGGALGQQPVSGTWALRAARRAPMFRSLRTEQRNHRLLPQRPLPQQRRMPPEPTSSSVPPPVEEEQGRRIGASGPPSRRGRRAAVHGAGLGLRTWALGLPRHLQPFPCTTSKLCKLCSKL